MGGGNHAKLTDDVLKETVRIYLENNRNVSATARQLGIKQRPLRYRLDKAVEAGHLDSYDTLPNPTKHATPLEIIARQKQTFQRQKAYADHIYTIHLPDDQPFGILALGDPHLDNQGTDLTVWEAWNDALVGNPRLRSFCLGDLLDNWVGKLERLWADNPMTKDDAVIILQHYLARYGPYWDATVGGNHDKWPDAARAIGMLMDDHDILYRCDEMRLNYVTPSGQTVSIKARHNWPGRSMYSPDHGVKRGAMFGGFGHDVLLGGDLHVSGYSAIKSPESGVYTHAVQVASFKTVDDYAVTCGFTDKHISPAVILVIDPRKARNDFTRVRVFHDIEGGLAALEWACNR